MPDVAALPMPYRKENLMTRNDPKPLFFPDVGNTVLHLMRVKPGHARIPDPITDEPIWAAMWELETCIGDEAWLPLADVRERLSPIMEHPEPDARQLLADCTIRSVLAHPRTPYGLGIETLDSPHPIYVLWRAGTYTRDDGGSLTPLIGMPHHDLWPRRAQWQVGTWLTRTWARRRGLL